MRDDYVAMRTPHGEIPSLEEQASMEQPARIVHRTVLTRDWMLIMPGVEARVGAVSDQGRNLRAVLEVRFDEDCGCPLRQHHFTAEAHDAAAERYVTRNYQGDGVFADGD